MSHNGELCKSGTRDLTLCPRKVASMGKMILCSGRRAKRPYLFSKTDARVYSIEEVSYYIYKNITFVDEDIFSEDFFDWIELELDLGHRAEKLRILKRKNADLKTLVTSLLCSGDYYSQDEIKSILKMVDEIAEYGPVKKHFVRANEHLKKGKYAEAVSEYERILNSEEAIGLSPENYGDILHNLALAKLNTQGFSEASEFFRQAYERNERKESLRQYLYALKMTSDELYNQKVEEYGIDEEGQKKIEEEIKEIKIEALESQRMEEINTIKDLKSRGMVMDYREKVEGMIKNWMESYRKGRQEDGVF